MAADLVSAGGQTHLIIIIENHSADFERWARPVVDKKWTDCDPVQKSTPGAALLLPCHAKGKMEVDAARTQRPVLKKESSNKFPKKKTLKHLR